MASSYLASLCPPWLQLCSRDSHSALSYTAELIKFLPCSKPSSGSSSALKSKFLRMDYKALAFLSSVFSALSLNFCPSHTRLVSIFPHDRHLHLCVFARATSYACDSPSTLLPLLSPWIIPTYPSGTGSSVTSSRKTSLIPLHCLTL